MPFDPPNQHHIWRTDYRETIQVGFPIFAPCAFFPESGKCCSMGARPNRLRELREAKGLSLKELGDLVGSNKTVMQRLETGATGLDVQWMKRLSAKLGVKPSELLNDEDVEFRAGPVERGLSSVLHGFEPEERELFLGVCANLARLVLRQAPRRGQVALSGDPVAVAMLADSWNSMSEEQRERTLGFLQAASQLSPPAMRIAAE